MSCEEPRAKDFDEVDDLIDDDLGFEDSGEEDLGIVDTAPVKTRQEDWRELFPFTAEEQSIEARRFRDALAIIPSELKDQPRWSVHAPVALDTLERCYLSDGSQVPTRREGDSIVVGGRKYPIDYCIAWTAVDPWNPGTLDEEDACGELMDIFRAYRDYPGAAAKFQIPEESDLVCLRLCHPYKGDNAQGTLFPWARRIIERYGHETYVEARPTSIFIWLRGDLPTEVIRDGCTEGADGRQIIYGPGQSVAVTGHRLDGSVSTITKQTGTLKSYLIDFHERLGEPSPYTNSDMNAADEGDDITMSDAPSIETDPQLDDEFVKIPVPLLRQISVYRTAIQAAYQRKPPSGLTLEAFESKTLIGLNALELRCLVALLLAWKREGYNADATVRFTLPELMTLMGKSVSRGKGRKDTQTALERLSHVEFITKEKDGVVEWEQKKLFHLTPPPAGARFGIWTIVLGEPMTTGVTSFFANISLHVLDRLCANIRASRHLAGAIRLWFWLATWKHDTHLGEAKLHALARLDQTWRLDCRRRPVLNDMLQALKKAGVLKAVHPKGRTYTFVLDPRGCSRLSIKATAPQHSKTGPAGRKATSRTRKSMN